MMSALLPKRTLQFAAFKARVARSHRRVALRGRLPFLPPLCVQYYHLVPESREDLNPIAVSLLRKRLLRLGCACVATCCDGGVSGAVSNKGM
jgi:hypothetical protein